MTLAFISWIFKNTVGTLILREENLHKPYTLNPT